MRAVSVLEKNADKKISKISTANKTPVGTSSFNDRTPLYFAKDFARVNE
jgi:hypothetical protein